MIQQIPLSLIRVPTIDDQCVFSGPGLDVSGDFLDLFYRYTLIAPHLKSKLIHAFADMRTIAVIEPIPANCPLDLTASVRPFVVHTVYANGLAYRKRCSEWFDRFDEDRPAQHVYFFLCRAGAASRIKIGISNCVNVRLHAIQRGIPFPVHCIGVIEDGGKRLERELHESFKASWVCGEWFRVTAELIRYIEQEATPWRKEK